METVSATMRMSRGLSSRYTLRPSVNSERKPERAPPDAPFSAADFSADDARASLGTRTGASAAHAATAPTVSLSRTTASGNAA